MDNLGYLIAAYLIIWAGLFGYLLWMSGVVRGLRAELGDLRAALSERERQPGALERDPYRAPDTGQGAETPSAVSAPKAG